MQTLAGSLLRSSMFRTPRVQVWPLVSSVQSCATGKRELRAPPWTNFPGMVLKNGRCHASMCEVCWRRTTVSPQIPHATLRKDPKRLRAGRRSLRMARRRLRARHHAGNGRRERRKNVLECTPRRYHEGPFVPEKAFRARSHLDKKKCLFKCIPRLPRTLAISPQRAGGKAADLFPGPSGGAAWGRGRDSSGEARPESVQQDHGTRSWVRTRTLPPLFSKLAKLPHARGRKFRELCSFLENPASVDIVYCQKENTSCAVADATREDSVLVKVRVAARAGLCHQRVLRSRVRALEAGRGTACWECTTQENHQVRDKVAVSASDRFVRLIGVLFWWGLRPGRGLQVPNEGCRTRAQTDTVTNLLFGSLLM